MRIGIYAVGRQKRGPERDLCALYLDRVAAQGRAVGITGVTVQEIVESTATAADLRRSEEAARLLDLVPPRSLVIALDERGEQVASTDFAGHMRRWLEEGTRDAAFLIGGPDGHAPPVRNRARLSLSFGAMTWPHGLVRVMLAEQIYRSVTILLNHPYHRS